MGLAYSKILERIDKHYAAAVAYYGENKVFGVFLYGSPNYHTDTPESDVDTKCILIPNIYDLAIKPLEVKHLHIDEEVCECMTIMHMVENWKKQNINFVEIMFTPYYKINPEYEDFWMLDYEQYPETGFAPYALGDNKCERVARYDMRRAVYSMAYQAKHTLKQDPTDRKKIMNAARIAHSLMLLTETDKGYKQVIRATPEVAGIRTGETELPEDYVEKLTCYFDEMIARADKGEWAPDKQQQEEVDCFLNDFILDLIDRRMTLD